ncbi:hypothetical protein EKH55_4766 [Sinorhizobium alkalisoli]|nr:hypothetical protein EKH55_4766 [Sinorhizobium alkalisoli]
MNDVYIGGRAPAENERDPSRPVMPDVVSGRRQWSKWWSKR